MQFKSINIFYQHMDGWYFHFIYKSEFSFKPQCLGRLWFSIADSFHAAIAFIDQHLKVFPSWNGRITWCRKILLCMNVTCQFLVYGKKARGTKVKVSSSSLEQPFHSYWAASPSFSSSSSSSNSHKFTGQKTRTLNRYTNKPNKPCITSSPLGPHWLVLLLSRDQTIHYR